jgi:hypothetical protein
MHAEPQTNRTRLGAMSIPVELPDLEQALADFGAGYLMTTSGGAVKVVTVEPVLHDGGLRITRPGKGTVRNLAENPAVTMVFPPREAKGFSLLVDGTGTVSGEDVDVSPTTAVLHRPQIHADGPPPPPSAGEQTDSCGNDCAPVT